MQITKLSKMVSEAMSHVDLLITEVTMARDNIEGYIEAAKRQKAPEVSLWSRLKVGLSALGGMGLSGIVLAVAKCFVSAKGGAAIMAALKLIGFGVSAALGVGILGLIAIGGYHASKWLLDAAEDRTFAVEVTTSLDCLLYALSTSKSLYGTLHARLKEKKDCYIPEVLAIQLSFAGILKAFKVDLNQVALNNITVTLPAEFKALERAPMVNSSAQVIYKETRSYFDAIPWVAIERELEGDALRLFVGLVKQGLNDFRHNRHQLMRGKIKEAFMETQMPLAFYNAA